MFGRTLADAVEAIHAAAVLGLGVVVRNELVHDQDDEDSLTEEWIVELATDAHHVCEQ